MKINGQFFITAENKVVVQPTGNGPLPRPNDSDSITSYGALKGWAYKVLSWFCIGPGVIKITDVWNNTMYLNKTELKNWIDPKLNIIYVTHLDETDDNSINEALTLILHSITEIGKAELLGEQAPPEGNLEYLRAKIAELKNTNTPFSNNLAALYQRGLETLQRHHPVDSPMVCYRLPDKILEEFNFTAPIYLREEIKLEFPDHSNFSSIVSNFYDYQCPNPNNEERYFVDFANENLGNIHAGFSQEGIMFAEAPELVDLKERKKKEGKPIVLRKRNENTERRRTDGPGQGNPAPLLVKNVRRVGQITGYGAKALTEVTVRYSPYIDPQKINVLAMAAPRIYDQKPATKYDINTVIDLFNTFVAGFRLAKEDTLKNGKRCVICTGKIGCGAFRNDPSVVYTLQMLAAKYVGVDQVIMHGFAGPEANRGLNLWAEILRDYSATPTSLGQMLSGISDLAERYVKEACSAAALIMPTGASEGASTSGVHDGTASGGTASGQ